MNDNRTINLLDAEQVNTHHETTHVHAYLTYRHGVYAVFVAPYRDLGDGVRGYPLGATEWKRVETATRFNAKRLAALAADPATLDLVAVMRGGAA
jgi:hypothetical protein